MPEPISLAPGKSDTELAAEYRQRMVEVLEPVKALLNEAKKNGLVISWNIAPDGMGLYALQYLKIHREY